MNILITGGGGYIGSILVGYLLKEKYNVTVWIALFMIKIHFQLIAITKTSKLLKVYKKF